LATSQTSLPQGTHVTTHPSDFYLLTYLLTYPPIFSVHFSADLGESHGSPLARLGGGDPDPWTPRPATPLTVVHSLYRSVAHLPNWRSRFYLVYDLLLELSSLSSTLYCKDNYSATSNIMKLVHWPLRGGLLHLVHRGGEWAGRSPLLTVPNVTAHPSTAIVPITVLLYNGPLLCGFNVPIKGLTYFGQRYCLICL